MLTNSIHEVLENAAAAMQALKQYVPEQKAVFLRSVATEIDALGDALLQQAATETNLS
ncbi:MAG: aldehyde dehydrogenase (NADP(+)), partial [Calditrichae bacterium]|nr:aldehyde dehydrogenase (NADP(+)) [Calditrichia bacterium]